MRAFLLILLTTLSAWAQPQALVGALRHGTDLEVSVLFDQPVHQPSLLALESYSISPGRMLFSRLTATNRGALITVMGVPDGVEAAFAASGVTSPEPNPMAMWPTNVTLAAALLRWVTIGGSELGLAAGAFAVGEDGFDVFSGGYQQNGDYDEATFVGEAVTGDFDRWVRVEYVQPSSVPARAGLMVREFLDEGKPRPGDPTSVEQGFSRYLEVAINPPNTATGAAGLNQHEIVQRAYHGGIGRPEGAITRRLAIENNGAPEFPDAWIRMRRIGQTFEMFRGTNGVDWISLGTAAFPEKMPERVYVGAAFSPQNGALPQANRRTFLAKFREYDGEDKDPLELKIENVRERQADLSWTGEGLLQEAGEVTGPWEVSGNQANPQVVDLQQPRRFFRLLSTAR